MKKYLKFMVFVSFICVYSSCDDYLETKSTSTMTEETAFINLDFATKAVYGIYANPPSWNMYSSSVGLFYKCDTDVECMTVADNGDVRSLAHYAGTDGSASLKTIWNILYQTIERANICIDNLPVSPIWGGEYSKEARRLYGEAITLRALMYYELITFWGDVPFVVKSTQAGDDFYLPKTDRDLIYEYLIQDLKDVEDYVPWMSETQTTERINKAFVKGLRARMALAYSGYSLRNVTFETRRGRYWEDHYKIANQECREIMESGKHQLNPSFEGIFKTIQAYTQDLAYKEVLFEIAYGRLVSGRIANTIGMPFNNNDPKYGRAAAEIRVPPNYFYTFDREDNRRNVSVELYNYSNGSYLGLQRLNSGSGSGAASGFSPCKWRKSWVTPSLGGDLKSVQLTGVNWPLMRYADVVLMFAESENQMNGPTQAAKDALALVRKRAFSEQTWESSVTHYIDSVSISKAAFFNAIVDERAWEFGGEMLRKNDLVRWNLLGAKIKEMKEECQKIINDDPEYANVPTHIFWKYKDNGETLDILNPDYRLPSTEIPGYTRSSWLPLMSTAAKTGFSSTLDLVAHGYDEAKNNHLYHIHADVITTSNGKLSNDQIP